MKVIQARNVHAALPMGLDWLIRNGVERESRNGPVLLSPCPVTTVYRSPTERVLLWPERDANPFFHFAEGLWMLAGRNDVAPMAQLVPRMADFSDDGVTLHGAYGNRWRYHFEIDQIISIIKMLKRNPDSRRCVLQMWDVEVDLGRDGRDIPCNTHIYFLVNGGRLDMTVCCRSNDMILGAYGANAVHFSMLQEFMAAGIGVPVGRYWQLSNNFHAYKNNDLEKVLKLADHAPDPFRMINDNPYCDMTPYKMVSTPPEQWLQDLNMFLEEGVFIGLRDSFFRRVAQPMMMAHQAFKAGSGLERYAAATEILEQCQATDWKRAGIQWIERRRLMWMHRQDQKTVEGEER